MNEKKIKVTDKRLFTQEGDLKEEYRHLEEEESVSAPVPDSNETAGPSTSEPAGNEPPLIGSPSSETEPAPSFFDLVAAVAQPIALYLGDVKMPDGESMENLQLARLHIDLLEVLQQRSAGNLNDQETAFLEDFLYQLRLRYVEKSKQSSEN